MKFTRLRLVGFKSFVEPTDFLIEPGLTGVVGPNGCGKSNLVEALRWVMGESSYKSLRASGMDDVIFSGSGNRPARNTAEVVARSSTTPTAPRPPPSTMPTSSTSPAASSASPGSTYRVNGKEVRARDVQLLFADASTGARSPAMVRQGQIGEIIAAKPQARRAHSRRGRRHRRPAFPPPRGGTAPQGRRAQSDAPRGRAPADRQRSSTA